MKVGIVGFSNLRYMPYLRSYTDIFDHYGIEYEIIYWNRRKLEEECYSKSWVFEERMDDALPKINKLISMFRFGQFTKNIIKNRKYDYLVILTTIPAILLSNYIEKSYPNRYLIDIRDYTYENFVVYRYVLKNILDKANMRVISSPAFKTFLPLNDYVINHNLNVPLNSDRYIRARKPRKKDVINISYIGAIAYFEEIVKLLEAIANDQRFILSFFGSGIDENRLKKYCLNKKIKNVYFKGSYKPNEKESFYEKTDIIFNAYGNGTLLVKFALSNKLYEAAWYYIPILVSPYTAMSEMAGYIGYELDYKNKDIKISDAIYNWYNGLDWERVKRFCDLFIEKVLNENERFRKELIKKVLMVM